MNRFAFFATLGVALVGCQDSASKQDLRPLVATTGYYALMQAPAPKPSDGKCKNCNGLGYLTDGTVRTLCPVCKGSKTECEKCVPNTRR